MSKRNSLIFIIMIVLGSCMFLAGCCSPTANYGNFYPTRPPQKPVEQATEGTKVQSTDLQKPPRGLVGLTMADLGLNAMDPGGALYVESLFPFKETPVFYMNINVPKYDTFFKDAAAIRGTVLLAQKIADALDRGDQEVFFNYKLSPTPPIFQQNSPLYVFGNETLPTAVDKTTSLLKTASELLSQVKDDFSGVQASRIPKVTNGINESIDNLKKAREELQTLVGRLK